MNFSSFRKLDYILFYIIILVLYIIQLTELQLLPVIFILMKAIIPAFILGTITNLVLNNK